MTTVKERAKLSIATDKNAPGKGVISVQTMPDAPAPPKQADKSSHLARRSDLIGSDIGLDLSTLGGRLAYARLKEEVTQETLAEAIDKVRGTINAYEANTIKPPIAVVEILAKVLKVSPSFLAFGEHGVKAAPNGNAAENTVSVEEVTFGRDGRFVSGAFAMPRTLAQSFVAEVRDLKIFVLDHDAPAFNLRAGARIFADTSADAISPSHDTYLIEVIGGMEIVRAHAGLTKSATIELEDSRGKRSNVQLSKLKVLGAVVSTLNHN